MVALQLVVGRPESASGKRLLAKPRRPSFDGANVELEEGERPARFGASELFDIARELKRQGFVANRLSLRDENFEKFNEELSEQLQAQILSLLPVEDGTRIVDSILRSLFISEVEFQNATTSEVIRLFRSGLIEAPPQAGLRFADALAIWWRDLH